MASRWALKSVLTGIEQAERGELGPEPIDG
jgi:hypothetical protein